MPFNYEVTGLKELRKACKDASPALAVELRESLKEAAKVVADDARKRIPAGPTGRAEESVRPLVSGTTAYVAGGKATVPYFGWLDFGSRTPRHNKRPHGPWYKSGKGPKKGRFIYPAIDARMKEVKELVGVAVDRMRRRVF